MTPQTTERRWISHAEYEELSPTDAAYARQQELNRRNRMGDDYTPSRQFPCPGTFIGEDRADQVGSRVFFCDECNTELGLPPAMQDTAAVVDWMIERSGLPAKHLQTKTEQTDGTADARRALEDWAKAHADGIVTRSPMLVGDVGTGKTQVLVNAAVKMICDTQQPIRYWSISELLAAERKAFDEKPRTSPVEAAKVIGVLILDDLGAERDTAFARDVLAQIVDARYVSALPILGATNLSLTEWPDEFGTRTASRLLEMTQPVKVTGADRRINA